MNTKNKSQDSPRYMKRLSVNTRLSAAKIFDEDSNESTSTVDSRNDQGINKIKSTKKNIKADPYKLRNKLNTKEEKIEYETNREILERRQKQIDYGKNTAGYDNYRKLVPLASRARDHPHTPVKYHKYSRRGWDGLIKSWRQKLHEFDPKEISKNNVNDEKVPDDEELIEFL